MLVSIKQYADIVGISYWKIREMCLKGEIPAYKFGNRFRINPDEATASVKQTEQVVVKAAVTRRPAMKRNKPTTSFVDGLNELMKGVV